jgi:ATP-dependent Clp protease ATP-binding subunit ClpA
MIGADEHDLTTEVVAALAAARRWARQRGNGFIGTEHLVWGAWEVSAVVQGAFRAGGAVMDAYARQVHEILGAHPEWQSYVSQRDALAALGVDVATVRREVDAQFGAGTLEADFGPAFTARAGEAIDAALAMASAAGRTRATAAHVAAAALADEASVAVDALRRTGVSVEVVRDGLRDST